MVANERKNSPSKLQWIGALGFLAIAGVQRYLSKPRQLKRDKNSQLNNGKICTLDDAKFLWEEYQYRHDLCWRTIFKTTAALVILWVIPYTQKEIVSILQEGILVVSFLALMLSIFICLVMNNELALFGKIKEKYRKLQKELFNIDHEKSSWFRIYVMIYLISLVLISAINFGFVWKVWIPYISPQPEIPPLIP